MQFRDGSVRVELVIKHKDIYTYGVVNLYVRRCRGGRYFGIVSYFRYSHHTEWLNMDRLGISKNRHFRY